MDALLTLFAITAILALLGIAATVIGVDTRDGFGSDGMVRRPERTSRGIA